MRVAAGQALAGGEQEHRQHAARRPRRRSSRRRCAIAKVPSGSHRGSRCVPGGAGALGGQLARRALDEDRRRGAGDQPRDDPLERRGRREQQQRRARRPRPGRRRPPAARSRRPWPVSSGPGGAHRADAVEHQRDGVGDVRRDRRDAGGQQRRVADQRGQAGDAADQARRRRRPSTQEAELRGAHRFSSTPMATSPRTTIAVRSTGDGQPPAVPGADRAADQRAGGEQPGGRPVDPVGGDDDVGAGGDGVHRRR